MLFITALISVETLLEVALLIWHGFNTDDVLNIVISTLFLAILCVFGRKRIKLLVVPVSLMLIKRVFDAIMVVAGAFSETLYGEMLFLELLCILMICTDIDFLYMLLHEGHGIKLTRIMWISVSVFAIVARIAMKAVYGAEFMLLWWMEILAVLLYYVGKLILLFSISVEKSRND